MPIANTCSIGYTHDGRTDNAAYRHDRRADNAIISTTVMRIASAKCPAEITKITMITYRTVLQNWVLSYKKCNLPDSSPAAEKRFHEDWDIPKVLIVFKIIYPVWFVFGMNLISGTTFSMSGNKVCVCYRLCIRHTTERAFALYLISESVRCYFHIEKKCFTHILSFAAYYKHYLAIFSFFETSVNIYTLYTVDATEYVTAQIDATFHEGMGKWRVVS